MKKYFLTLLLILGLSFPVFGADTKISGLDADTAPTSDDLITTVNDPGGSPANKKVTIANLSKAIDPAAFAIASQAGGDIFYASSASAWARLAKGTAYQLVHMNSGATAPEWTSTLGATGTRLTAGFFTDLTVTNAIAGSVTGNAATATALAADPANCAAGQIALGVTAAGVAECTATPSGLTSVGATTFTGALTGNASTATALAADPADCAAGQVATGIAASGALTCTATPSVTTLTGNVTGTASNASQLLTKTWAAPDAIGSGTPAAGAFTTLTASSTITATGAVLPAASNTPALGSTSYMWSDLFLGDGAVINFNNGDVTITHSSNTLTVSGGTLTADSITVSPSTDPTVTFSDSSTDETGTGSIKVDAATVGQDSILKFYVDDSTGEDTEYMEIDGSSETIDMLKPIVLTGAYLSIGADPADAGVIRLPNAGYIYSEADAAGTDISVIGVDSSEVVQIGASGASGVTITPATTIAGGIISSKVNAASGSANSVTASGTIGAMNGSDTFRGLFLDYTNANHSSTSNTVALIDIDAIAGDAEANLYGLRIGALTGTTGSASEVEYGIYVADGWDAGFVQAQSATIAGQIDLYELSGNGTDYISLKSGDDQGTTPSLTISGSATNENLTITLGATDSNTATVGTTTGVTSLSFSALNLVTTGTISGAIPIQADADGRNLTAAECYGYLHVATGAGTWLLPAAAAGMNLCVLVTTSDDVIIDVDASDDITLVGVQDTDGDGITNATGSSTGDFVCLIAIDATHWYVMGKQGTWTAQ